MNLLYLPAAIPVGFFKVRVIISCCIFMSKLLFGLCFRSRGAARSKISVP